MARKILLTSFETWLPHQVSNSSDDLLERVSQLDFLPSSLTFLRKLPVDFELAPALALAKIEELQPDVILCCGMAEGREKLTVESRAVCGDDTLQTSVDLEKIISGLSVTEISHDAGKFVCEALYYSVLNYLCSSSCFQSQCIFVHVPILRDENLEPILADFLSIIKKVECF
ncbi:MAG: peptidase C15 [Microcoleus vaginatus WJT46-NPBG5]|jgi:pyroglutamyl-peptidase|nr:peptidase C15 [Microcoleus vaginatus WJT46-NPBG5]